MSKSLGNSLVVSAVLERVRPIDLRFYIVAAHYRSHVEFSDQALVEHAAGFQRIENFLGRAAQEVGEVGIGEIDPRFAEAMDDDLGAPAAVAVIYDLVREGNKLLGAGSADELRRTASSVRAMLDVMGIDPFDPHWAGGAAASSDEERLRSAVDALVGTLLEQRQTARATKDFTTADAIRDRIKAAGIEVEDTASGPSWSLS
jgi:cysteinyl-tRNA synthetase